LGKKANDDIARAQRSSDSVYEMQNARRRCQRAQFCIM
jgi:hypothetical protein